MMYIIFILNFNIVFMNSCHYFIITWTDSIIVGYTCLLRTLGVMIYVVCMVLGSKTSLLTVMIFFKCQCYSEDRETLNTTSRN